ncbi:hypothetical protein RIF29_05367 [Crotalaria pallida]|uniref:Alpha-L-arabinofuranosidase C-terminal domain-containing protein n=1 Tax=Crotalaria pallida TaxID=3830 RepID=A0AAN9PAA6_CROPI
MDQARGLHVQLLTETSVNYGIGEYAVRKNNAANGTLYAAVVEAAFLIWLEKNSDIVEMVCYAPLFLNINDKTWTPDAIVFDSYQLYGTPSYWVQKFFIESSGALFLPTTLKTNSPDSLIASAISKGYLLTHNNQKEVGLWLSYHVKVPSQNQLTMRGIAQQVVNFGIYHENLHISINGLKSNVKHFGSKKIVLTSVDSMDENSFSKPMKVVPQQVSLENASKDMNVVLPPYSVTSFDLII